MDIIVTTPKSQMANAAQEAADIHRVPVTCRAAGIEADLIIYSYPNQLAHRIVGEVTVSGKLYRTDSWTLSGPKYQRGCALRAAVAWAKATANEAEAEHQTNA